MNETSTIDTFVWVSLPKLLKSDRGKTGICRVWIIRVHLVGLIAFEKFLFFFHCLWKESRVTSSHGDSWSSHSVASYEWREIGTSHVWFIPAIPSTSLNCLLELPFSSLFKEQSVISEWLADLDNSCFNVCIQVRRSPPMKCEYSVGCFMQAS